MVPQSEHLMVPFEGERSGTEPLSWGQLDSWGIITRTGVPMCVGGIEELPPTETINDVIAATRFVMSRHESLRTHLRVDAYGRLRQVLEQSGEVAVEIANADEADPAEVARQMYDRYTRADFDHAREWPIRLGVVRRHGVLTHAVVAYSHMATDGPGLLALVKDMDENLKAEGGAPVAGMQPLDQARRQQTPAGRTQSETVLRSWEKHLRRIPPQRFAPSADPRHPRFWEVTFTSRAMRKAVTAIAGRNRVGSSPVLLASLAVVLARITGNDPTVVQVMVSNRFRPGFADSVSPLSQGSLCVIDVGDASFDEVVGRANDAAMKAYLSAYYDPAQLDELLRAVGRDRGQEIDLSCFYNDRRFSSPRQEVLDELPTAPELRADMAGTTLEWGHQYDRWCEKFFLHVDDAPDVVRLFLCADTHVIAPADIEDCLRGMEEIVVRAATTVPAEAV